MDFKNKKNRTDKCVDLNTSLFVCKRDVFEAIDECIIRLLDSPEIATNKDIIYAIDRLANIKQRMAYILEIK
jgi:hypothetical protein